MHTMRQAAAFAAALAAFAVSDGAAVTVFIARIAVFEFSFRASKAFAYIRVTNYLHTLCIFISFLVASFLLYVK